MSPTRAPGAVKARDCLLSSRSHAPGPGGGRGEKGESHSRGGASPRSVRLQKGGGCVGARVEKEECCQSLGQIGSWSKQSRETWTHAKDTRAVHCQPPLSSPHSEMETTTITTTQTAFTFGLTDRHASLSLRAPAQDCAVPAAQQPHPINNTTTTTTTTGFQSKTKVLKRQRSSSPELLRCKRRLSFNGLGYSIPQQQPVAVARRNERERNRVKQVNMGFQTLRQHVPNGAANKKMSKVETLRSAVEYIRALQQLLDEHDAVSAAFQCGLPSPTLSNSYSADPESPHSTYSSDEGSYEPLSSEEQELLDFTTWFDRY